MRRLLALLAAAVCLSPAEGARAERWNLLLICVDDLRPELGHLGAPGEPTPAIDALAARGVSFAQHFAAFPTCGASRRAMLTGCAPSAPRHYTNGAFADEEHAPPTLPLVFRRAGYRTVALGKVGHAHDGRDLAGAWDATPTDAGPWGDARHLLHAYADGERRVVGESPLSQFAAVGDDAYPDARLAAQAIEELRELAAGGAPFLLAVGFFKPHLPFCAPARYLEAERAQAPPPVAPGAAPEGLGAVHACRQSGEVTANYACPAWDDGRWSAEELTELREAYRACVRYVDAQIGALLAALEESDAAERTVVALWGDHGFHLGEQGLVGKHATFDAALRSALVIAAPGVTAPGTVARWPVSSLDLLPTLCELCGVPAPEGLPGRNLAPALRGGEPPAREGVWSWWRAQGHQARILRTPRWRFVRWTEPGSGEAAALELYDLEGDGEARNVAAQHPELVARLSALEPPG